MDENDFRNSGYRVEEFQNQRMVWRIYLDWILYTTVLTEYRGRSWLAHSGGFSSTGKYSTLSLSFPVMTCSTKTLG